MNLKDNMVKFLLNAIPTMNQIGIAWYFSRSETLARYRNTVLGPLWMVLGSGIGIVGLVVVWGKLLPPGNDKFVISVGYGLILWQSITFILTDSCSILVRNSVTMTSIKYPPLFYTSQVVFKAFINYLHALLLIPILVYFTPGPLDFDVLFFLMGTVLFFANLSWIGHLLAMFALRFRDVEPIVSTIIPLLFFLTPVLFRKNAFEAEYILLILNMNPFTLFIEIARSPLIGDKIALGDYIIAFFMAVVGWTTTLLIEKKVGNKLVFWI